MKKVLNVTLSIAIIIFGFGLFLCALLKYVPDITTISIIKNVELMLIAGGVPIGVSLMALGIYGLFNS